MSSRIVWTALQPRTLEGGRRERGDVFAEKYGVPYHTLSGLDPTPVFARYPHHDRECTFTVKEVSYGPSSVWLWTDDVTIDGVRVPIRSIRVSWRTPSHLRWEESLVSMEPTSTSTLVTAGGNPAELMEHDRNYVCSVMFYAASLEGSVFHDAYLSDDAPLSCERHGFIREVYAHHAAADPPLAIRCGRVPAPLRGALAPRTFLRNLAVWQKTHCILDAQSERLLGESDDDYLKRVRNEAIACVEQSMFEL